MHFVFIPKKEISSPLVYDTERFLGICFARLRNELIRLGVHLLLNALVSMFAFIFVFNRSGVSLVRERCGMRIENDRFTMLKQDGVNECSANDNELTSNVPCASASLPTTTAG